LVDIVIFAPQFYNRHPKHDITEIADLRSLVEYENNEKDSSYFNIANNICTDGEVSFAVTNSASEDGSQRSCLNDGDLCHTKYDLRYSSNTISDDYRNKI